MSSEGKMSVNPRVEDDSAYLNHLKCKIDTSILQKTMYSSHILLPFLLCLPLLIFFPSPFLFLLLLLFCFFFLSSFTGLGGCIRGLTIRSDETNPPVSQSVNLFVASRRSVRVYLDGCPTSESRYNCRGNDSVLVYSGRKTQATDYSLQPFTGKDAQYTFT